MHAPDYLHWQEPCPSAASSHAKSFLRRDLGGGTIRDQIKKGAPMTAHEEAGPLCRDVVQPTPCVPGLRVKQVAAGGMHSCVLTDTGEVSWSRSQKM